jgi:DHA1 family tetracycline resistance protein-like MFS transporter
MGFAPTIWWLLAGRAISGITSSSIGTTYAYLADLTPPQKRAGAFGLLGAVFGLGFLLGPGIGGLLGDPNGSLDIPALHLNFHFHGDPRLPFFVAGGLSLCNVLLGFVVLPESLPPERREAFRWRRANPWAAFRLLQSHADLLPLAGVQLIALCANYALLTLLLMCGAVGFAIFGLATTSNAFVIGVPITTLWGMAAAATQSLMSHRVAPWEQGKLQGANMGLSSIAGLIAPLSFGWIYSQFTGPLAHVGLPGAPFLAAAILLVLALGLALLAGKAAKRREADEPSP